jgi:DNA (cytosine-5)-methyltransferase 1
MLRVIKETRPTWVLGENVAGIIGLELDNLLSDLEKLNYAAWPIIIPACALDAKHRRDRVWIVAHAQSSQSRQSSQWQGWSHIGRGSADRSGAADSWRETGSQNGISGFHQWSAEPRMGRVAYGIPNRAHRLRGLGNAIVPQVAEQILKAIIELETKPWES